MPSSSRRAVGGRHELGQNFLVDRRVAARIAALVPPGPVLELGAGDGALTRRLAARAGTVTSVELDPDRVAALRRTLGGRVRVVHADLLRFRLDRPHHVVSNVPFGITTPLLRHLLRQRAWTTAVLLLQWEVARKRAAVGGTTLLTASWWPWYEFGLAGRVPASAFRPRPSVDGGILVIRRRPEPLVPDEERAAYQRLVREAFRGDRLLPALRGLPAPHRWLAAHGLSKRARPGELDAGAWAALHRCASARLERAPRPR
ncbi:MAG TPA: 23S ribosomal RNA methyltransferase Erm [Pseudonocardia sp.]|jgi:23S rRNA (adenine-N6)-dimethyltransferase|uniref:23S ribosomal RNA methyltransferase Erm n=1 Tax=Pseudonocardia sp. TaxID=60912 RepID=UPI002B4B874A|nr:23S ribosomal RNA methyltransferase Erm [Pseudonocardia sp.]HLU53847.1 23S ribosomal RNA methyltransferase Erm [Pseudonocardia sp.]